MLKYKACHTLPQGGLDIGLKVGILAEIGYMLHAARVCSGGISQIDVLEAGKITYEDPSLLVIRKVKMKMGGKKFLPVWLSPRQMVVRWNILIENKCKKLLFLAKRMKKASFKFNNYIFSK